MKVVGVFVNESIENIIYLVREMISLTSSNCIEMKTANISGKPKNYVSTPVIKAFECQKLAINNLYKEGSDFILLDAGAGDGKTLDESILKDF